MCNRTKQQPEDHIPWFSTGTHETTDIVFCGGDLEPDFVTSDDRLSLCGTELGCCFGRDLDLDLDRQSDLNRDLTGEGDRRGMSLDLRLRSTERRRADE